MKRGSAAFRLREEKLRRLEASGVILLDPSSTWVEEDVRIGAGTITCNFDRFRKNPTSIGSGAFIGSGAKLVAPVKVGRNAVVGAGSTITKDVPAWSLAVARSRQKEFRDWAKRKPGK